MTQPIAKDTLQIVQSTVSDLKNTVLPKDIIPKNLKTQLLNQLKTLLKQHPVLFIGVGLLAVLIGGVASLKPAPIMSLGPIRAVKSRFRVFRGLFIFKVIVAILKAAVGIFILWIFIHGVSSVGSKYGILHPEDSGQSVLSTTIAKLEKVVTKDTGVETEAFEMSELNTKFKNHCNEIVEVANKLISALSGADKSEGTKNEVFPGDHRETESFKKFMELLSSIEAFVDK